MRTSWTRLAALAAAGFAWAGVADAQNINFGNTATRQVLIQVEDTPCDNTALVAPPGYAAPAAGCTVFANSGTPLFTDPTNDLYGELSKTLNANEWKLEVKQSVWLKVVLATIKAAGGTVNSNSAATILFNTSTGAVAPATPPYYYTAAATVGGIGVVLSGVAVASDRPFYGSSVNPSPPPAGIPLELSCAGGDALPPAGSVFGPAPIDAPLCDPLAYIPAPGFSGSAFTALTTAIIEFPPVGSGSAASHPAWAPFDWKLQEATDTNNDGIPDLFDVDADGLDDFADTDDDGDGTLDLADNCRRVQNGPTGATLSQCDADGDGYGNSCDPDLTNTATANVLDNCSGQGVTGFPVPAPCGVNTADINSFRTQFNNGYGGVTDEADANCSGGLNTADINRFRALFNNLTPGSPTGSPPGGRFDSCLTKPFAPRCVQP